MLAKPARRAGIAAPPTGPPTDGNRPAAVRSGLQHQRWNGPCSATFLAQSCVWCRVRRCLQQGKMPMHQAFDVPRNLVHRNVSPFRRIHRACATAVYVVVAFIAVLPSLMLTFLALVGAVWIKQFF